MNGASNIMFCIGPSFSIANWLDFSLFLKMEKITKVEVNHFIKSCTKISDNDVTCTLVHVRLQISFIQSFLIRLKLIGIEEINKKKYSRASSIHIKYPFQQ